MFLEGCREVPERFPKGSRKVPDRFPKGSRQIPETFPNVSGPPETFRIMNKCYKYEVSNIAPFPKKFRVPKPFGNLSESFRGPFGNRSANFWKPFGDLSAPPRNLSGALPKRFGNLLGTFPRPLGSLSGYPGNFRDAPETFRKHSRNLSGGFSNLSANLSAHFGKRFGNAFLINMNLQHGSNMNLQWVPTTWVPLEWGCRLGASGKPASRVGPSHQRRPSP